MQAAPAKVESLKKQISEWQAYATNQKWLESQQPHYDKVQAARKGWFGRIKPVPDAEKAFVSQFERVDQQQEYFYAKNGQSGVKRYNALRAAGKLSDLKNALRSAESMVPRTPTMEERLKRAQENVAKEKRAEQWQANRQNRGRMRTQGHGLER